MASLITSANSSCASSGSAAARSKRASRGLIFGMAPTYQISSRKHRLGPYANLAGRKRMRLRHLARSFGALVLLAALGGFASAQEPWPSRPIRLVVPLAAGGGVDMMARLTAQHLA